MVGQPSPNPTKTRFGTELSPNNAYSPTEIDPDFEWDQSVGRIPSEFEAGLEQVDDSQPGTLQRKLQFDAAACGLGDDNGSSPKSTHEVSFEEGEKEEYLWFTVAEDGPPMDGSLPDDSLEIKSNGGDAHVGDLVGENPTPEVAENGPEGHNGAGDHLLEDALDKEVEKQERKYKTTPAHRNNSTKWHQKWISKGVPRTQEPKRGAKSKASSSTGRPQNLVQAKDSFISQWIKDSNLPPSNDRRKEAIKAWMESPLRANLMAGRAGVQK